MSDHDGYELVGFMHRILFHSQGNSSPLKLELYVPTSGSTSPIQWNRLHFTENDRPLQWFIRGDGNSSRLKIQIKQNCISAAFAHSAVPGCMYLGIEWYV